jgi:NAD+ diphosphatase
VPDVPGPNAFTGVELDRADDARRRDAAWLTEQMGHPGARAVVAGTAGVRASDGALELVPLDGGAPDDAILLGVDAHGPVFAIDEDPPPAEPVRPSLVASGGRRGEPPPTSAGDRLGLREAGAVLARADAGLAAYAVSLLNWHRGHRFCANCGASTKLAEAGFIRRCAACGTDHHPRVDPVVIMLVTDDDRVLLGRQRSWPARRYSALAGFVSPGESLEEAVAREVDEEAGVSVGTPRYVSSQPWPFPGSLMMGFTVPWAGGEPGGRDDELQDVRWFARAEVAAAAAVDEPRWDAGEGDGGLLLPPRLAIARMLLEGWLGEPGPG